MRISEFGKRYEKKMTGLNQATNRDVTRERFNRLAHPDIPHSVLGIQENAAHYTSGETAKAFDPRYRKAFGSLKPITRMNDGGGGSSSSNKPFGNIDPELWEKTPHDERWKLVSEEKDREKQKKYKESANSWLAFEIKKNISVVYTDQGLLNDSDNLERGKQYIARKKEIDSLDLLIKEEIKQKTNHSSMDIINKLIKQNTNCLSRDIDELIGQMSELSQKLRANPEQTDKVEYKKLRSMFIYAYKGIFPGKESPPYEEGLVTTQVSDPAMGGG